MRLWHYELIPLLPRQQLLGQHRECCALRGNGWGKKHSTVDYVFKYHPYALYMFHKIVMAEMKRRGYEATEEWYNWKYRGKKCAEWGYKKPENINPYYPEHTERYLQECIDNLEQKGVIL